MQGSGSLIARQLDGSVGSLQEQALSEAVARRGRRRLVFAGAQGILARAGGLRGKYFARQAQVWPIAASDSSDSKSKTRGGCRGVA